MKITMSAPTYDPSGFVELDAEVENAYQAARRGSVTATLDGGSSVYDTGYSVSDQTVIARVRQPSEALLTQMRYLVALYPELYLSLMDGFYACRASFSTTAGDMDLNLRLLRRIDG